MTSEELASEQEVKKTYKKVRIVKSRGKSAVVEWVYRGKAYRKTVPLDEVEGEKIDSDVLKKCPDYGVPWAKEVSPDATPGDLEEALHNAGIWTAEDAFKNPSGIIGALNATYKTGLAAILKAAKKYKNKE
jgi:hypothetical protein